MNVVNQSCSASFWPEHEYVAFALAFFLQDAKSDGSDLVNENFGPVNINFDDLIAVVSGALRPTNIKVNFNHHDQRPWPP